jgi:hypothetical protein
VVSEYPADRIVVTGSRGWKNNRKIFGVLRRELAERQEFLLGIGDCPTGADAAALWWGRRHLMFPPTVFYAPWTKRGRYAGILRNHFMIDMFRPQLVLAFLRPESVGTVDCKEYAESLGIEVRPFYEGFGEGDANGEVQEGRT